MENEIMIITGQNGEIVDLANTSIYLNYWCEDLSVDGSVCTHSTTLLSMPKAEIKDLFSSVLFNSSVMITAIIIVMFILKKVLFGKKF